MMQLSKMMLLLLGGFFSTIQALEPEEVGAFHTKAFEELGAKYASNRPKSRIDVMADMSNILSAFCHTEDAECESRIHAITLKGFHSAQSGSPIVEYPEDFEQELIEHLDAIHDTINLLQHDNLHDIVTTLTQLHDAIRNMENVNQSYKDIAVGASSIAIESTKLWHDTFTKPDHNLHSLIAEHHKETRKLQDVTNETVIVVNLGIIPRIISADILGAVNGTLNAFFEVPFFFLAPYLLPFMLLYYGTIASTASSFNTTTF